jgi:cell division protein FtsL
MLQAIQLKFLVAITGILLSILGIVAYEHRQAEAERQAAAQKRKAEEDFWKDLKRREQHPDHSRWTGASEFLRTH